MCLHTCGMLCNILILFIFKITTYCETCNFSTFDFFLFAIFKVNFYFSLIIMLCLNSIFQPLELFPLICLIFANILMAKLVSKYKQNSAFGLQVRLDLI